MLFRSEIIRLFRQCLRRIVPNRGTHKPRRIGATPQKAPQCAISGWNYENLRYYGLRGGGCSHLRTGLHGPFPGNREINRNFPKMRRPLARNCRFFRRNESCLGKNIRIFSRVSANRADLTGIFISIARRLITARSMQLRRSLPSRNPFKLEDAKAPVAPTSTTRFIFPPKSAPNIGCRDRHMKIRVILRLWSASQIALVTAAVTGAIPPSPAPFTPRTLSEVRSWIFEP